MGSIRAALLVAVMCSLALAGCARKPDNNRYRASEVGVSKAVAFGTILSVREITIFHDNSEGGATVGGAGGAGAGTYVGDGTGKNWATASGGLIGALLADEAEQDLREYPGVEYVITMRDGNIKTIVQEITKNNPILKPGDKVMVQYCDVGEHNYKCKPERRTGADFQRVLPVSEFPPEPRKKKRK
jgi:outer membrane lipoprotein SlyB